MIFVVSKNGIREKVESLRNVPCIFKSFHDFGKWMKSN